MSDLYRSAIGARLAKLPQIPQIEEDEELQDTVGSLPTGMGPPAMPARTPRTKRARAPNPEFSPLSASSFFADAFQVSVPSSKLDVRVYYTPPKFADGTVMIFHHGAGYSGLSFACLAKEVVDMTSNRCGVLSFDARRHGKTTSSEHTEDLSVEILTADLSGLIQSIFHDPATAPTLLLIGHSMGGSVVVRACPVLLESGYKIAGVAVLDVVEGSAIDALPHMHSLLNARPEGFDNPEHAIEWHLTTKAIHNANSARVSVPSIITPSASDSAAAPAYLWRTPLRSTAPYWSNWFTGLSSQFLAMRTARLLVLAGTDRLDKELMIGQMQGKFQLVVVPGVGHMLHEDNPTRLAEILVEFWRRHDRIMVGVKKVGEL